LQLQEWNDRFCRALAKRSDAGIEGKSDADSGWWTLKVGQLGLLVMDEGEAEVQVWLLDSEGRTNGPAWIGNMAEDSALQAATEIGRLIKETPDGVAFEAIPPAGTDRAKQDLLNDIWRDILVRVGRIRTDSLIDRRPDEAVREIEAYIDKRARADSTGTLGKYAGSFKVQAAELLRREL
jgi:hypothetical protein